MSTYEKFTILPKMWTYIGFKLSTITNSQDVLIEIGYLTADLVYILACIDTLEVMPSVESKIIPINLM